MNSKTRTQIRIITINQKNNWFQQEDRLSHKFFNFPDSSIFSNISIAVYFTSTSKIIQLFFMIRIERYFKYHQTQMITTNLIKRTIGCSNKTPQWGQITDNTN